MKKLRHFVITGGHHNSALVVAQALVAGGDSVTWIGHRHAAAGDQNDSAEYLEVTAAGIPFVDLHAGKSSSGLVGILATIRGIFDASSILKMSSPSAVISFGGYLGFATATAALLLGLPVFIHEQTVIAGKANKLLSRFARRTYLTWGSSARHFPKTASLKVVGLPLRPSLLTKSKRQFFKANGKPILFFLCGKQGSHIINEYIFKHHKELLSRYNLIHQTGTHSLYQDFELALALKNGLPESLSGSYLPISYAVESDLGPMLDASDLVIGRSGAHITYELGIKGKRAVLIPYLLTHGQEQLQNARFLEVQGLAKILPESKLTFPRLVAAVAAMLRRRKFSPLPLPENATQNMIQDMLEELGD